MTKHRYGKAFGAAALGGLLLVSGTALAYGGGHGDPAEHAAKMEQRVKEHLAPELGLDDATAAKLAALFKQSAEQRHVAMQAVKAERETLRELVDRKATQQEIAAQLAKLEAAKDQLPAKRGMSDEVKKLLTPEQQAKLVLMRGDGMRHHGRRGGR